jgi:hypothetical protein
MGVFFAFIDLQLGHQDSPEPVFGDHSPNRVSDQLFGVLGADLFD